MIPSLRWEEGVEGQVAGVDEVGRGCLAGPVVASAVILPRPTSGWAQSLPPWIMQVKDSKMLSQAKREELAPLIEQFALSWSISEVSHDVIDRINIYHASHQAMVQSIDQLAVKPDHVLVDGNRVPVKLSIPATAIVAGDSQSLSIACASILAKVFRDQLMADLSVRYPGYGLEKHKGYPTAAHRKALASLGVSPIHRRSFGPVALLSGKT